MIMGLILLIFSRLLATSCPVGDYDNYLIVIATMSMKDYLLVDSNEDEGMFTERYWNFCLFLVNPFLLAWSNKLWGALHNQPRKARNKCDLLSCIIVKFFAKGG